MAEGFTNSLNNYGKLSLTNNRIRQREFINTSRSFHQNIKDFFKKFFIFLKKSLIFYFGCSFGFLSKNGFLEEALTGMANTCLHPFKKSKRWAAKPAENMTRVSTR